MSTEKTDNLKKTNPLDGLLTIAQASTRIGKSTSWLYKRTMNKTVRHFRLGKTLLFAPEDIDQFVAKLLTVVPIENSLKPARKKAVNK